MKSIRRISVILLIFLLASAVSIKPLIILIVRDQLKARSPGSTVAVSDCRFISGGGISFEGIRVNKLPDYDVQIRSLAIGFIPASIFKIFQGDLAGAIESCNILIDNFVFGKVRVSGGYLRVSRKNDNGSVGCSELKYEKLKISDIKGRAGLERNSLRLEFLSGQLLGGTFKGDGFIELNSFFGYQARIDFSNLDLETFMKDFAFDEKAEVSGKVHGFLKLQGDLRNLVVLEGDLASGKEGGTLTIKDTRFLANMARSSGQALNLVVESFKDYRYNTGKTTLSLQDNNLVFLVNLDGSAGKRDLNIVLHDFNSGRIK